MMMDYDLLTFNSVVPFPLFLFLFVCVFVCVFSFLLCACMRVGEFARALINIRD